MVSMSTELRHSFKLRLSLLKVVSEALLLSESKVLSCLALQVVIAMMDIDLIVLLQVMMELLDKFRRRELNIQ